MNWEKVEKDVEGGPFGLFKWVAIAVLLMVVLFGGINLFMKPASVAVDRIVMKNSFQYREGMEQRGAILAANIAEVDMQIAKNPSQRAELTAQRKVFEAQLRAITINQ